MPAKNGFELQDGDIELLHAVYQLRIATIDHLAALSGRTIRALWGRLFKLKERRYLTFVARFMQKQVYAIGSAGVPVLIEHGYARQEFAERRIRHHELTEIGIRHSLFIADIHMRMLLLTRTGPIQIADWQEGPALWDSVVPRVDAPAIPVRPDAYFILKHAGRPAGRDTFRVFLEADRSTMSHERMATKRAGYVAYYEQAGYRKKYPGMRSFIVATVTQTRERAEELRKDLHPLIPHAASRDAYLFIPFEDLALTSLLPKAAANAA
ncbi:MAG TPA: replication-relaxation family protein [Nitrospira sp.]|nr:replication-relaxation family protein [Nitrospira sp.]